jgi:hypothetical protein
MSIVYSGKVEKRRYPAVFLNLIKKFAKSLKLIINNKYI